MLKKLPRNVWILSITSLLTDISTEMIVNVLPLFLYNVLGVRTSVIGLIDGIAEATASLVKIVSGNLSDRLGKRKLLAVLGYGMSALTKPLFYFANTWGWVLSIRFVDRVGKGVRNAPRDALIAGSIAPEQRGLAFGMHRAADTLGAFIGLGLAALIIWLTQSGAAELSRQTFQAIVLVSMIPAILGVLVLGLGAREVTIKAQKMGEKVSYAWSSLDLRFRQFLVVVLIFTLGNSSDAFIILRGQERGLSVLQVMLMVMTFNLVYSLLSGPLGALSDRLGRRQLILWGWLVYGLIYLGFAFAQVGMQVWALFGLYGIYYASTEGIAKAYVADLVAPEQRGTAYGLFNGTIGFMALPASLIAGLLLEGLGGLAGFGPAAPFVFGALMALLAGGLFAYWIK